ncbi:hypothetical protein HLK59_40770 [Streptomyces sp. S3(2020)]|uniref:hypothetical protein n=1 Tax=Streptomyces sp. S3(2020) TaxID=2732044 RepID=UPI001489BF0B|nr:hypothetical protein [Streptomyces sp. S3(2020)]NNN36584.1 hypothetical protein [Streptomyces sp. S3(2020)]
MMLCNTLRPRRLLATAALMAGLVTPLAATAPATAAPTVQPQPAAAAGPLASPKPDCADNGNVNPCYEYQTWFWTFDACNSYAYSHPYNRNRYDRHVCAVFTGGTTVGLWFHKVRG